MSDIAVTIFDIGFTYNIDGPGQRMVVYFKGCNLRCPWCASPESIAAASEVLLYPDRAPSQVSLIDACPYGAVSAIGGEVLRDTDRCRLCELHPCTDSGTPAFELCGRTVSVSEIISQAEEYRPFFGSNGGITIGGGESTCQFQALEGILAELHKRSIDTALETNGTHLRLPEIFPLLDMLLIDLKHPLSEQCREIVGLGNEVTLANIAARWKHGGDMVVRIPLVPGYNSDEAVLYEFGKVLASIGPLCVEILPFHRRGEIKWRSLGLRMPAESAKEPSRHLLGQAYDILQSYGLHVK